MTSRYPMRALVWAVALVAVAGCGVAGTPATDGEGTPSDQPSQPSELLQTADFPAGASGKADVFGRALVGVAQPYEADLGLTVQEAQLQQDMGFRRQVGWQIVQRVVDPAPLLGVAELATEHEEVVPADGEIPKVPRWQTWYGVEDFKRMFRELYSNLSPAERAERKAFSEEAIKEIEAWNASAQERSDRWPLDRFLEHVSKLGVCPESMSAEECALSLQSNFSGATAGNARITYSPGTMKHLLRNYGAVLGCLETLGQLGPNATPDNADQNFSYCFESEFPADAVLTKAHWVRADFNRTMPAFDTDADALGKLIGPSMTADWGDGDRDVDPWADKIFTIRLRNGDMYRLAGLHIMTKELRHWVWITLWWSDRPDSDFGEDRPEALAALNPLWSNYKMGVVVDYEEGDANPAQHFAAQPTLAAALNATQSPTTWLSNPYIEHGRGNARTNCIGCHQHGGSTMGPDLDGDGVIDGFDLDLVIANEGLYPQNGRQKQRSLFPADYLWSTLRVDNLAQVMKTEVDNFVYADRQIAAKRIDDILALPQDHFQGEVEFQANCTACHGGDGKGTVQAPSLYERVPSLDDEAILTTLIHGKNGGMPSWGHLSDRQLADIFGFLRYTFFEAEDPDDYWYDDE